MELFLEKVNYEISRAAEYLESAAAIKHPEFIRMQIECLQDSVSLFHIADASKKSRNDFKKVLADAQSMLEKLKVGLVRAESEEKSATITSRPNLPGTKSNLIEIPKFCGDPLKFRHFMTLFADRVVSNSSLTDIEKFILLKNYLESEAFDVINEIPIIEKNFSLSLSLLEEMYGDEDKCIDMLFERLELLPAALTGEISEIRETYWKLEAILLSLEQYGVQVNDSFQVLSLYSTKFDVGFLGGLKLGEIRNQVRQCIGAKQRRSVSDGHVNRVSSSPANVEWGQAAAVVTNEQKQSKPEMASTYPSGLCLTDICIFCHKLHLSEDCVQYPTVYERKKLLRSTSVCWRCLCVKHPGERCVELKECVYCNDDSHHRILCPEKCRAVQSFSSSSSSSSSVINNTRPTTDEILKDDCPFQPTTPLTVLTQIECPKTGEKTTARLIIASGCPISLISERAAARLGINYFDHEKSIVLTHATGEISRATKAVATVLLYVSNGPPFPIDLHVVEEVCRKEVVVPELLNGSPAIVNFGFAYPGNGHPIDILIGGDTDLASVAFNCGLNGEVCPPMGSGKSWVSSKFGWLLVGTDTSGEPVIFSFSIQQ